MTESIFSSAGGSVVLPGKVLCDRQDGGHLIVNPPRPVWERSCLTARELAAWSWLVAAAGRAMLETLPVLRDACLNYWEAGNWALNDLAEPPGAKDVHTHRRVHLHIFGRSRHARHADWRWGESPKFPDFIDSAAWAKDFSPLNENECRRIAARIDALLRDVYRFPDASENAA